MSQQQGSSAKLIAASEAYFSQVSTDVNSLVIPFTSESLILNRNLMSSKTIRSSRNPQSPVRGNVEVAGDISFELAHQHGLLLRHALGSYTAVSGETVGLTVGTYKHTMKVGTLPVGLTIEKQFTDLDTAKYFQYSGCKVGSLKMAFKSEGFIESSVSVMGAKETVAAASMDSSTTDLGHDPFDGFQATITDKSGASLGDITEVSFSLENNLDGSNYIIDGTGQRKSIPAGTVKVTGNLKALFENVTLYTTALNATESSTKIVLKRGTGVGTAGNEQLTIYIQELIFKPKAPAISGPQGMLLDLDFEAYYSDDAAASALYMELLSTQRYY